MHAFRRLIALSLLSLCLSNAAPAQTPPKAARAPEPTVTVSAIPTGVRFAAPNRVARLKLEVLSGAGEVLFEVSSKGSVLDWTLHDGNGQLLADGSYLCVVTVKSLNGKISQRVGTMSMLGGVVTLQAEAPRLTAAQQHAVGPIEEDAELTVLQEEGAPAAMLVAHDGRDGQLTSTAGALTFRTGDVFAGKEKEQMRLTEDGRLGIGTSDPQAKLDVAGTIRATKGIEFSDGTVLTSTGRAGRLSADGEVTEAATGTGTQNRIAKWVDNAGTLGDSVITESAGNIGIGTATPTQALEVANGRIVATGSQTLTTAGGVLEIATTVTNNNNGASGFRMRNTFNGNATFQQALDVAPTFAPSANISIARGFISTAFFAPPAGVTITDAFGGNANTVYNNTSGAVTNGAGFAIRSPIVFGALKPTTQYGLRIFNQGISGTNTSYGLFVDAQSGSTNNFSAVFAGGNVGIGNTNPLAPLDVVGNINTSTQYNIGGNRVLSIPGAGNTFVGVSAGTNNTGESNSFFGRDAGNSNTTGGGNSFFGLAAGKSNTTGSSNSFFGLAAGRENTTGFFNSFFGTQAGYSNTSGEANSFFGWDAGVSNTDGGNNSSFGMSAGYSNTTGGSNSFFGNYAGFSNSTGVANTYVGAFADSNDGLNNATAIGARAFVTQSNSLVLGSINGVNDATAHTSVGIGTTAPLGRLQVVTANDTAPHIVGAWDARHFVIGGAASGGGIGMSYGGNEGYIMALSPGVAYRNLVLQFAGGNVGIGGTAPGAKLQVSDGDIAITTQLNGLILRATDGANCFRLTVNNAGALTTASVPCP